MSDFLNQFLQEQNNKGLKSRDKKVREQYASPILHQTNENPLLTFIIDRRLEKRELTKFKLLLQSKGINNYQILNSIKLKTLPKDDNKTQWKIYANYKWDFSKYIPKWSKIISFGKSIFSITESNDLDCSVIVDDENSNSGKKEERNSIVQGFYDLLLKRTYFFDPLTSCYVYPVDSWNDLFFKTKGVFKNNFEKKFLSTQIEIAKDHEVKPQRIPQINKIAIPEHKVNTWLVDKIEEEQEKKDIEIGFDTETKGLDPWSKNGKIICLTISYNGMEGYYLPADSIDPNILKQYLRNKLFIGTNLKYDTKWIHLHYNIPFTHLRIGGDTEQAQAVINGMSRKGLKSGAYLWTKYGGYDRDLDRYIEKHKRCKKDYSLIPFNIMFPYATIDPCASLLVHREQMKYIKDMDYYYPNEERPEFTLRSYYDFRIKVLNLYQEIECVGIGINFEVMAEREKEITKEINEVKEELYKSFGTRSINFGSDEQLSDLLESKGWPIFERGIKGYSKTGAEFLKKWEELGYEEATLLLQLREKEKIYSTYIGYEKDGKLTGIKKYIRDDGLIHSEYRSMLTMSGRHRGRTPNPQNWPSHGEKARLVRSYISPIHPYYQFLSTDYSGLQLRLACIASGDEAMRNAFINLGGDLHTMSAFNIFFKGKTFKLVDYKDNIYFPKDKIEIEKDKFVSMEELIEEGKASYFEDTLTLEDCLKMKKYSNHVSNMRFRAKSFNFGLIFGASAFTVAQQNISGAWSIQECEDYISENDLWNNFSSNVQRMTKKEQDKAFEMPKYKKKTDEEIQEWCYYLTVASHVRQLFFKAYPGLDRWIKNTTSLAKKQGYTRSVYGAIRRLPYLTYDSNRTNDVDMKKYSNNLNISLNSPIQSMEAYIVNRWMLNIKEELTNRNMKSCMNGQIHDAKESLVHENEIKDYALFVHIIGEKDYPEYNGIPLEVESNLANYWQDNELWDMGNELKVDKENNKVWKITKEGLEEIA